MLYFVVILDIWKDEPVAHKHGGLRGLIGKQRAFTECGRPIADYKPGLPTKHAAKFARPCKSCFPEGVFQ